jgi:probable HAF family extracellular repeat protein
MRRRSYQNARVRGRRRSAPRGIESLESRLALTVAYNIIDLGPGQATAVNDAGTVTGSRTALGYPTFLYQNGNLQYYPLVPTPNAIAPDGTLVGINAAEYQNGTTTYLPVEGNPVAYGINASDQVVGQTSSVNYVQRGFLYSGGQVTLMPTLGGAYSSAHSIDSSGLIAGSAFNVQGFGRAVEWDGGGTLTDLGTLGGTSSTAMGINDFGYAVGSSSDSSGNGFAFIYDGYTMRSIGILPGTTGSEAVAINRLGEVIGRSGVDPVLWQGGQVYNLNDLIPNGSGWILNYATGLSDSGEIVGEGALNGVPEAYALIPTSGYQQAPSASLSASDITAAGGASIDLTVTYSGPNGVDTSTLGNQNIYVTGPHGLDAFATYVGVAAGTGGTQIATYQLAAPSGTWSSTDDGTYTVWLSGNQVLDTPGNVATGGSFGQYQVNIPDTVPPTATLEASDLTSAGQPDYQFTVTYADNVGVQTSSLATGNIQVMGPNGYSAIATFIGVDTDHSGPTRVATYQLTAPDGIWSSLDDGTYSVSLIANQVDDTSGNFAAGGVLGSFQVKLPVTSQFSVDAIGNVPAAGFDDADDVVGTSNGGSVSQAQVWQNGNVTVFGAGNQQSSYGLAVNTAGTVVGYDGSVPVSWTGQQISYLPLPNGDTLGTANAINSSGMIVGQIDPDSLYLGHAAAWVDGALIDLGLPAGAHFSWATAINDQGQVVGDSDSGGAWIWQDANGNGIADPGEMVALPSSYQAVAINDSGQVIGSSEDSHGNVFAVLWNPGATAPVPLGTLAGTQAARPIGIDNRGEIVGDTANGGTETDPFFWSNGVMSDLNSLLPTGWQLMSVTSINNNGEILGLGRFDLGAWQTVILKPNVGDYIPPTATASLPPVAAGTATYQFTVTYQDNVAVDAASPGNSNIQVTGPNGYQALATLVGLSPAGNSATLTATYRIAPPDGVWDSADRGNYNFDLLAGQIRDTSGNFAASAILGDLIISSDISPPTATFKPTPVANAGLTDNFVVNYTDDVAVALASLATGNILVTGPNGFSQVATFVGATTTGNAPAIAAVYQVTAPSGNWGSTDDGTYDVSLVGGQVLDTSGNAATAGLLGSFDINTSLELQYELTDLDDGLASATTAANGINNLGQVVGQTTAVDGNNQVYTYDSNIGQYSIPHIYGFGRGINDAGVLTGEANFPTVPPTEGAFVYQNGTLTDITPESPQSPYFAIGQAINNVGVIVGYGRAAFGWYNAAGFSVSDGWTDSAAYDVNDKNQAVVNGTGPYGSFIAQGGGGDVTYLDTPTHAMPLGINDITQVVGSMIGPPGTNDEAFLWQNGVTTNLGVPTGFTDSQATAINLRGDVVGQAFFANGSASQGRASVWLNGVEYNLNDLIDPSSGMTLIDALAINDGGQIVGTGLVNGWQHGFLLTPDLVRPTITQSALPDVAAAPSAVDYSFSVTYGDNQGVAASSFGNANILVTGPNGFQQMAQYVPASNAAGVAGDSTATANYQLAVPVGGWQPTDNGTYYVFLNSGQVSDTSGNYVSPELVGSFSVNVADTPEPQVSATSAARDIVAPGAPATIDPGFSIANAAQIAAVTGATVSISAGFAQGQDQLRANTAGTNIQASYDSTTGILTLTGQDSAANYQAVLTAVTYQNTSGAPSLAQRTITYQVVDFAGAGSATRPIVLSLDEAAALATTTQTLQYIPQSGAHPIDSSVTVTDLAGVNLQSATVTLAGGYDSATESLSFTPTAGINGSFQISQGVLTLSGLATAAAYQQVLRSVTFVDSELYPTTAALTATFAASDGFLASDSAVRPLLVNPTPWQNPIDSYDVDNSGDVAPLDALIILNQLNSNGVGALAVPTAEPPAYFFDVSGDNATSPLDALIVLNYLNAQANHTATVSPSVVRQGNSSEATVTFESVTAEPFPSAGMASVPYTAPPAAVNAAAIQAGLVPPAPVGSRTLAPTSTSVGRRPLGQPSSAAVDAALSETFGDWLV